MMLNLRPPQRPAEEQAGPSCALTLCKRKHRVPKKEVCGLCRRRNCDPDVVGELCHQDGLCVHENCLYHASGLEQRGADDEGFYGFLFSDIQEKLKQVAQKYHASGLEQRGADDEGFYGFLFSDIQRKLKRVAQKHCSAVGEDDDSWECSDCSDLHTVFLTAANPESSLSVQGPSHSTPAPGTSSEREEARILEGHPDDQLPSQSVSQKPADSH
ncbi:hypothetical protein AV530_003474 [Patagioenas fasciata monilis]|uniref:PHD finger protein 7 n=1 Tax=Patagioenas fasciata monilis TaxID=372326 RepID=A0A1V4K2M9_PATFA|nr:hypothetical protein AV530_003474 [Patagioenas fasciata monilis]